MDFDLNDAIQSEGVYKIAAIQRGVNAVCLNDESRNKFGVLAREVFKKYVIVQNDILQYPVCIYRFSVNDYAALWMRCTHQGTELQAFGDTLQCPAHGSEFTNKGFVQNGPADKKLRTFPVIIENNQLKISLKAA